MAAEGAIDPTAMADGAASTGAWVVVAVFSGGGSSEATVALGAGTTTRGDSCVGSRAPLQEASVNATTKKPGGTCMKRTYTIGTGFQRGAK